MPRLSLGLGVQAVSKVKSGGAAPGPLLIATTPNISVFVPDVTTFSMTQAGGALNPYWQTSFDENNCIVSGFAGDWRVTDGDGDNQFALNPSTSLTTIPTTGWTKQGGNPIAITITAA
jgi:hypothetical protein